MDVSGIDYRYSQSSPTQEKVELDSYEQDIEKQLTDLRGQMRSISNDQEKTEEEKSDEKKDVQKQIQELNAELRKHQVEKRMEDAKEKQEEKQEKIREETIEKTLGPQDGFGNAETGVLMQAASAKEQLNSMSKIRTTLEGRLAEADSSEERKEILNRIQSIFHTMGNKIREVNSSIQDYQKDGTDSRLQVSTKEQQEEMHRRMGKGSVVYSSDDGIVIQLAGLNG